jgi:hypothetical protein
LRQPREEKEEEEWAHEKRGEKIEGEEGNGEEERRVPARAANKSEAGTREGRGARREMAQRPRDGSR